MCTPYSIIPVHYLHTILLPLNLKNRELRRAFCISNFLAIDISLNLIFPKLEIGLWQKGILYQYIASEMSLSMMRQRGKLIG